MMDILPGWKTKLGAVVTLLGAAALIGKGLLAEPINWDWVTQGVAALGAALGIFGIGKKIDRATK